MDKKYITTLLILIFFIFGVSGCNNSDTIQTGTQPESPLVTEVASEITESPLVTEVASEITETPQDYTESTEINAILADLEGLKIDEFFEESYTLIGLRYPESLVELGIAGEAGLNEITLNNISDAYIKETQQLMVGILKILGNYDRKNLSRDQQISYDVYEWYLDDQVRGIDFMYNDYPATFFGFSTHMLTEFFFTEIHPINNKQDVEEYVIRLGLVKTKYDSLIEGLKLREAFGIVPPKFAVEWTLNGVDNIAYSRATATSYYLALEGKIGKLQNISSEDKEALLAAAETAIKDSVIPAYMDLSTYLNYQLTIAPVDDGVWQFTNGEEYYNYLLRHYTSTEFTADEIHTMGLKELDRIHSEMREIFEHLGYPEDETILELLERAKKDGGIIPQDEIVETFEGIIEDAYKNLDEAFDIKPNAEVIVIGSTSTGGYYMPGSLDGSRPGAFYAFLPSGGQPSLRTKSITYHETVPGHHLQIAIAQERDLPLFRNIINFNGYTEGWALYAENLAWELGWYEDDPYGNLGRLQLQALRAVRLVVDTGIHTKGWTFEQATEFFMENAGWNRNASEYQIARYIVIPGQSTGYMIGLLKILELRELAMNKLGDQFDLKDFHNVVLSNGSMPLNILEEVVIDYITEKLNK